MGELMDPASLGAMAVGILAPYLTEAGNAVAKKVGESASVQVESLLASIKRKFSTDSDDYASRTLARLEEQPTADARKRALADVVAEKAEADAGFRDELGRLVEAVRASPTTMQFLTQVYGGQVGEILNVGSVQTLNIGRSQQSDRAETG
jgi:hypothetical protein